MIFYRPPANVEASCHEPAARLEPIAKEVEPLARLLAVADARLVGVQGQAVGIHPRRYSAQCRGRLRFRANDDASSRTERAVARRAAHRSGVAGGQAAGPARRRRIAMDRGCPQGLE